MKRLHVHVAVNDLDRSTRFYTALFGAEPVMAKPDYAKWMLDDPRVNFAISQRGASAYAEHPGAKDLRVQHLGVQHLGVQHLGVEAETPAELGDLYQRLRDADGPVRDEGETTCCYARSEKAWISDPQGVAWEAFLTTGARATLDGSDDDTGQSPVGGCCARPAERTACCV